MPLIVILGPTAAGKTLVASHLADRIGGEVISADSRQVYRRMNLGTGKDYDDYIVNGQPVPCHLIDIVEPGTEYNLFRFQQDYSRAAEDILFRDKVPVVCGGTGLYIQSVLKGFYLMEVPEDPGLRQELSVKSMDELRKMLFSLKVPHNTTDLEDRQRLVRAIEIARAHRKGGSNNGESNQRQALKQSEKLVFGIHYEREMIRKRITARLQKRLQEGLINEVNDLLDSGISPEKLEFYGLEYRYISQFLTGLFSYDEMFMKLNTAIHQFAKRQMTWFRKLEREGIEIKWIDGMLPLQSKVQIICGRIK